MVGKIGVAGGLMRHNVSPGRRDGVCGVRKQLLKIRVDFKNEALKFISGDSKPLSI